MPQIPFYQVDIRRVITNLIINAGQASQAGDTITITLTQKDENVILDISDQGFGITEKNIHKVFLPHFTTKEEGSGLGLASCKQIIEIKHSGKLTFKTHPGKGTTFRFTLPINRPSL